MVFGQLLSLQKRQLANLESQLPVMILLLKNPIYNGTMYIFRKLKNRLLIEDW